MSYDIVDNYSAWLPTDEFVVRDNPQRMWFQVWKPKLIRPRVYQKFEDGEWLRVAILMDHGRIYYAESL